MLWAVTENRCPTKPALRCASCRNWWGRCEPMNPVTFKQWLADGVHEIGEPGVAELMVVWMVPLLTQDEADRLVSWHLGVRL